MFRNRLLCSHLHLSGIFFAVHIVFLLSPCNAANQPIVVEGLRGFEAEAKNYAASLGNAVINESFSAEYTNGNTYVRFSQPLVAREVHIFVPDAGQLNAEQTMELGLKIFTARQLHATRIVLVHGSGHVQLRVKDTHTEAPSASFGLEWFAAVAGATHLHVLDGSKRPAQKLDRRSIASAVSDTFNPDLNNQQSMIFSRLHQDLGQDLANIMSIPLVKDWDSLKAGNALQSKKLVYYLAAASVPVNFNFLRALADIHELASKGHHVVMVSPYLPYSRSDKIDQPGIAVAGRFAADLIEAAGARSIVFTRAHAAQSEGFFDIPTIHVSGRKTLASRAKDVAGDALISPDNGAAKDVNNYAELLQLPMAIISKIRNPLTTKIEIQGMTSHIDLKGKTVALIDDETASGSTFAEAAKFLKTNFGVAKVYGLVVALNGNAEKAIDSTHLDGLIVTDSIPVPKALQEKVKVLSLAQELAEHLLILQRGFAPPNAASTHGCDQSFRSAS